MTWQWLLADGAQPEPGAREALEAAAAARPDARLVGSRLLGPGAQPWPELFAKDRAIAAARDRLLAVRALPAGSLLVREDVLGRHGAPPQRWGPDLAWSAEVLRDGGGYLAPESVVRRVRGGGRGRSGTTGRGSRLRSPRGRAGAHASGAAVAGVPAGAGGDGASSLSRSTPTRPCRPTSSKDWPAAVARS